MRCRKEMIILVAGKKSSFTLHKPKCVYLLQKTKGVRIRCGKEMMILAAETISHIYAAEKK